METNTETIETITTAMGLRIALLEADREAPLTSEQRARLPEKLTGLDESIHPLRAFLLMDGGSEPGTIFHPALTAHSAVSENATIQEAPHG